MRVASPPSIPLEMTADMRRNTKTMYEWRKAYRDKEELMLERGFPEVSPHEFYRDLFPEGSLQSAEHDGKGNVIATQIRPSGKGRTKQWVIIKLTPLNWGVIF